LSYVQLKNDAILRPCFQSEHAPLSSSMPKYVEVALCPCGDAMHCATLMSFEYQLVWDTLGFTHGRCWILHCGLHIHSLAAPIYRIAYLSPNVVIASNSPPKQDSLLIGSCLRLICWLEHLHCSCIPSDSLLSHVLPVSLSCPAFRTNAQAFKASQPRSCATLQSVLPELPRCCM
jgi:hypothetical protein